MPIYAIENSGHDDKMMVDIAHSLGNGGPAYSQYALVKGWMFPLYLRIVRLLRIPYIQSIHILNAALSVLTVYALNEKKVRPFHYFLYLALVFNPVFASVEVMMRVYRNAFSALMAFTVVIAMIAVYLRRMESKKSIIPWLLLASIALPAFWYSREDSIWLLPFLLGVIAVTTICVALRDKKRAAVLLVCMLLPIFSLEATTMLTRLHRQIKYGEPIVNELSEGSFPDVMKAIYAVQMEQEEPLYVDASRAKIRLLYEHSETLKALSPYLEAQMDRWSQYGRLEQNHQNKEVENGWFFWCLRSTVSKSGGFGSLRESQEVFAQIARELETAIDEGKLKTRAVMPSALMPPWKPSTSQRLMDAFLDIVNYVPSFSDVNMSVPISWGDPMVIGRFEDITGNTAVHHDEDAYAVKAEQSMKMQRIVLNVYQRIWPVISWMGRIAAALCALLLLRKNKDKGALVERIWILAGVLGALLTLYVGVAYNHAESCHSITVLYLSAAYALVIFFDLLALDTLWISGKKCLK